MDRKIMRDCFNLPKDFDCDSCDENRGIEGDSVGPCGQQNCWYSCTVCRYNNSNQDVDCMWHDDNT